MRKVRNISFLISFFAWWLTNTAQASAVGLCPQGQFKNLCTIQFNDTSYVLQNAIGIILAVAVVLALFFLIWGGIKYVMSGGDKSAVESARGTIIAAIVGLVIAFLAFFIVSIITYILTGDAGNVWTIPTLYGGGSGS